MAKIEFARVLNKYVVTEGGIVSQFIDSIKEVKRNWKTYDAWEQNQADDAAKREYLSKKLELPTDKVALTREKTKIVLRASDMLDKRSENNCEDTERTMTTISLATAIPLFFLPSFLAKSKMSPKTIERINLGAILVAGLIGIGISLWGNEKQKEASRIGRFQAKQHELKDIKNFVIYTPEQIEAAKIVAKNIPDKKDDKDIFKVFEKMKQMSKDTVAYKKWLKDKINDEDELQKVLNTNFFPEQIEQGQEDKEIITNIVKDINLKAEEYSENMENAYDTMGTLSGIASIPLAYGINKFIKKISPKSGKLTRFIAMFTPVIVSLSLLFQGTTQQKKAAQVGRFKKSQEILNNPEVLMNYTDEQMKQAQHIKATKQKEGFFKGIFSDFTFFKTYLHDKNEYDNYVKTTGKENEKLFEALKQAEVSDKQLNDAKFIQDKTFMTFDKIDEMSQRYSEDTEAGSEIAKQIVGLGWSMASITGLAFLFLLGKKGHLPMHKLFKWASDLSLNKGSSIRTVTTQAHDIIKNNKLKKEFCKAIFSKNPMQNLAKIKELKPILETSALKAVSKLPEILEKEDKTSVIKEILNKHFKQDKISKWFRNLVADITKLWAKNKIMSNSKDGKLPKELEKSMSGKYKNYKTLYNSLMVGSIPLLGMFLSVPWAFNSWLNNVQKKAGKIGIMKAMNDLDNPQLYVNTEESK